MIDFILRNLFARDEIKKILAKTGWHREDIIGKKRGFRYASFAIIRNDNGLFEEDSYHLYTKDKDGVWHPITDLSGAEKYCLKNKYIRELQASAFKKQEEEMSSIKVLLKNNVARMEGKK